MFAARALHVQNVIRPALSRGEWVVCDRFTDATRAYQGSGRGVDAALIEALALAVHGDLKPDCTLLLDLPVRVGLGRARARQGATADRFEADTVGFFEKGPEGYLALARREPQRLRIIDAAAPLSEVEQRIAQALGELQARERRAGASGETGCRAVRPPGGGAPRPAGATARPAPHGPPPRGRPPP